jgi:hypothetical protein
MSFPLPLCRQIKALISRGKYFATLSAGWIDSRVMRPSRAFKAGISAHLKSYGRLFFGRLLLLLLLLLLLFWGAIPLFLFYNTQTMCCETAGFS